MARKEIRDPLDRTNRNNHNDNYIELYEGIEGVRDSLGNLVDEISDEALNKVVDNAKLNWKEPVDEFSDLPSGANEGDTRMTKDDGKVYRYDGSNWIEIQQIDAGP